MGEIGEGKYGLSTAYYLYNGNDRNDCICSIRSNGSGRSCNGYFWSDRTGGDNGSRRRCSSRCDIRNCSTGNVSETNLYHCSHIYLLYRVSDTLFKKEFLQGHNRETYDKIMLVMDSIGLGIFTVVGVNTGISHGYVDYMFLLVFLGTITGVGGGLLRDIMGRSTSVYSGETYLCLCFNRGSNRLCGAVSEFWCSGVNGRSVSSSYIGQIPCGTLQMEIFQSLPEKNSKEEI